MCGANTALLVREPREDDDREPADERTERHPDGHKTAVAKATPLPQIPLPNGEVVATARLGQGGGSSGGGEGGHGSIGERTAGGLVTPPANPCGVLSPLGPLSMG